MKGTNKQFARYLDSEYNDYPVEVSLSYTLQFNYPSLPLKSSRTTTLGSFPKTILTSLRTAVQLI